MVTSPCLMGTVHSGNLWTVPCFSLLATFNATLTMRIIEDLCYFESKKKRLTARLSSNITKLLSHSTCHRANQLLWRTKFTLHKLTHSGILSLHQRSTWVWTDSQADAYTEHKYAHYRTVLAISCTFTEISQQNRMKFINEKCLFHVITLHIGKKNIFASSHAHQTENNKIIGLREFVQSRKYYFTSLENSLTMTWWIWVLQNMFGVMRHTFNIDGIEFVKGAIKVHQPTVNVDWMFRSIGKCFRCMDLWTMGWRE